ncbi:MAG: MBL fold metallo-hydrolase [Luteitalea sp.]|nr:MBL fold metallo-hydrolase [Luteitalea sp.]
MQLTLFQSSQGDCLLLSNAAATARILVDGGMPGAYRDHVAPTLAKLRKANQKIDLVYISHIDQDHIGGILEMLDDEVTWRVHEYQTNNGNPRHKTPHVPRPPEIRTIWHNSFHEQLTNNAAPIEEALAAAAPVLSGADLQQMRQAGSRQAELVTSIKQAIQVSRRIGPKQLGIPLNPQADGKLLMVREGQKPITIGGMKITIVGPTSQHLKQLREKWQTWLRRNQQVLETIRETARKDEEHLGTSDLDRFFRSLKLQAEAFGNPSSVTPENLASLMLLVEQGDRSILLTGDARWDQLIDGLQATGRLRDEQPFTVDVLKVPHHGSEHNIVDTTLLDRVIATDYVFCANGQDENPDLDVVALMVTRRLTAPGRFTFWFNSSKAVVKNEKAAKHMAEVEKLVRQRAKGSKGRFRFKFLTRGSSLTVA